MCEREREREREREFYGERRDRQLENSAVHIHLFHCHVQNVMIPYSLPFAGASSIPLCYIPFPSTLFHQLVFHPPSLHLAIYFLVYLSAFLFPNSYIILFWGILFSSILCTCPNQCNLFNLIVSVIVGFFNHCINFFIG